MDITILTPDKEVFKGKVVSVKVPGSAGQFQVFKNHAPIVSSLEHGLVTLVTAKGEHSYYDIESGTIKTSEDAGKKINFEIQGGFIEVLNNNISLLVRGLKNNLENGK